MSVKVYISVTGNRRIITSFSGFSDFRGVAVETINNDDFLKIISMRNYNGNLQT